MVKISEELEAIDNLLMEFHERIRSGRCLVNRMQSAFLFDYLHRLANKDEAISFTEACKYTRLPSFYFQEICEGREVASWKEKARVYRKGLVPERIGRMFR